MGFEWYGEFIRKEYIPRKDEVVVVFRAVPSEGMSMEDAAGRIASESSIGT